MKKFPEKNPALADWIDKQEILQSLPISSRTLQTWRTKKIIQYSKIGNKILYYLPGILQLLRKNMERTK
ncbi:MAG TPA: hypothetical protein PKM63_19650 [Panacibacter sp.]|nr:hypothetical protein [Panacibacter sp.]HNP46520.1 hypothetical protein [Panacibacter sp.]